MHPLALCSHIYEVAGIKFIVNFPMVKGHLLYMWPLFLGEMGGNIKLYTISPLFFLLTTALKDIVAYCIWTCSVC